MRRLAAIAAAVLISLSLFLTLTSCTPEGAYVTVYRSVAPYYRTTGELLRLESVPVTAGSDPILSFIEAFNTETNIPELENPLPAGCSILYYSRIGNCLTFELSPQYAKLSGSEKTIADSCIALSFCGLDGVTAVRISVDGEIVTNRLTADEIIIED